MQKADTSTRMCREDGFELEWLSPIPNYFTLGERIISQIRRIGITAKLQTMERGTFFDKLEEGDTVPTFC